jgi:GT2 family glycosyltransferase
MGKNRYKKVMFPGDGHRISIIVLTYDKKEMLVDCLDSLEKTVPCHSSIERMVVDNGSHDGTEKMVKERFPRLRVVRIPENVGFSAGMNAGLEDSSPRSEYIVLLSNDLVLHGHWLEDLIGTARTDPSIGIVGCKLIYPDGLIQHAGGAMDAELRPFHIGAGEPDTGRYDGVRELPFVTGAVILLRRSLYEQVSGFDQGFTPYLYEDLDLCYRARRAGFKVMYTGATQIIHRERTTVDPKNELSAMTILFRNHLRFLLLNFNAQRLLRTIPRVLVKDLVSMLRKGNISVLVRAWLAILGMLPSILLKRRTDGNRWPLMG